MRGPPRRPGGPRPCCPTVVPCGVAHRPARPSAVAARAAIRAAGRGWPTAGPGSSSAAWSNFSSSWFELTDPRYVRSSVSISPAWRRRPLSLLGVSFKIRSSARSGPASRSTAEVLRSKYPNRPGPATRFWSVRRSRLDIFDIANHRIAFRAAGKSRRSARSRGPGRRLAP